jgi:hypothetical protein
MAQRISRAKVRKIDPEKFLTARVIDDVRLISKSQKDLFRLWKVVNKVEHLPNGTPFKVTKALDIRLNGGAVVAGLEKPLILVSDLLSKRERLSVAQHELTEFNYRGRPLTQRELYEGKRNAGHMRAVKEENPILRKEATLCEGWFQGRAYKLIGEIGHDRAVAELGKLTRKDYIKWRDSPEVVTKHGPRPNKK